MFCRKEVSIRKGSWQKHIKYICRFFVLQQIVLRKCVALKMKGKCFVTRAGEGIRWKTYVILPDKSKEKGLHKVSSINSSLVSYLTSVQLGLRKL